jgi:hypothetical protein
MACQEGIEPPTHSLEGCCSIQLSYWHFMRDGADINAAALRLLLRVLPNGVAGRGARI